MSQEIKCLKSRRARKVVPVQDVDMNQLMQNYGMESDSDESADEDFSPTNVESNSSEDSQNESSSSSSDDDDDDDDEVTASEKQPKVIPAAKSVNNPSEQQAAQSSQQVMPQEQSKQKQQQLLVQFQQLPPDLQQLVIQQLQAQKLPKQQQAAQQQSIQQQLQLQLAKLQLLQQQLQKQQLPKLQSPQQLLPKQPLLQQQSPQQQSPQQKLPQQQLPQQQSSSQKQSVQLQTKKKPVPQQLDLKQQQKQLTPKQSPSQPQGSPVMFSQLPSKVQELLVKQLQQSGQGLQQLQQSKFLLLNAQQASSTSSSGSSGSSSADKLDQKGDAQTSSSSKQTAKKVTQITVKQLTGAVQAGSQSKKEVTKKVVHIAAKQTTEAVAQSSQQKQAGHKQQSSNKPQDTGSSKGTEVTKQRAMKDGKTPQRRPAKNTPKDTVDKEDTMNEEQQETETAVTMESPTKEETETVEALTSAVKKEVNIMLCFVCLEESKAAGEDMAQCDHCGITVHEGCYGVPDKSDDEADDTGSDLSSEITTPWFCDSCRAGVDQPSCELCPSTDGVFKQTIHGSWVHMVCSLYVPGVEYVEPDILSGVSLDQVPANKWGARACQLCEDEQYARTGVCISCDAGLCKSYFHVTCAQRQGLLCEEEENSEDDEEEVEVADPYYAYCKLHCNKDVARSKRRNWLALMSHYKQFSCDHFDSRAKSALLDQRSQYQELMEKMITYYKPDEQCVKQERWLHHHPKAFRQLVKKAELLGHTSDAIMTTVGGRNKITPSLSCDFVNYYIERNGRIKTLQELNDQLFLTNQLLSEDCTQLQEQVSAYELNQQSVQLQGTELQDQLEELYKCIQTGCVKPLAMPSFLSDNTGDNRADDQCKKCSVCSSSSDQHLVITCDTCDKHYHIGCLDPPLTKVPKKSTNYGWQCETCCCDSEDDLKPSRAPDGATSSRSGRAINRPSAYKQSEETPPQQKAKKRKK